MKFSIFLVRLDGYKGALLCILHFERHLLETSSRLHYFQPHIFTPPTLKAIEGSKRFGINFPKDPILTIKQKYLRLALTLPFLFAT